MNADKVHALYRCAQCRVVFRASVQHHIAADAEAWFQLLERSTRAHVCHEGPSVKLVGLGEFRGFEMVVAEIKP